MERHPRPALPRHRADARRRACAAGGAAAPGCPGRRCWWCCGRWSSRTCGSRPSSRSTGCWPSPRGTAGAPDAEPILLQFAADQLGRPVDRAAVLHFALPDAGVALPGLAGRRGRPRARAGPVDDRPPLGGHGRGRRLRRATAAWPGWRWSAGGFPPSAVPFVLLALGGGGGRGVPGPLPVALRPLLGAALVGAAADGASRPGRSGSPCRRSTRSGPVTGTLLLAALWIARGARGASRRPSPGWARPH